MRRHRLEVMSIAILQEVIPFPSAYTARGTKRRATGSTCPIGLFAERILMRRSMVGLGIIADSKTRATAIAQALSAKALRSRPVTHRTAPAGNV
jgi:hypothetical protein